MWTFLLGLLMGYAAKTVYDLFKDEELPASFGLNSGRVEALMDETRQMVRDLRDEVRQAATGEGTIPEKAGRALSAAGETIKAAVSSDADDSAADEDAAEGGTSPGLTGSGAAESPPAAGTGQGQSGTSGEQDDRSASSSQQGSPSHGSSPTPTHGTLHTMS